MPKFDFNVHTNDFFEEDTISFEFPFLDAVQVEALQAARESRFPDRRATVLRLWAVMAVPLEVLFRAAHRLE